MVEISSWGRLTRASHVVIDLNDRFAVARCLEGKLPGLAYGSGRSYGDVCLNPAGTLWMTRGLDRFIEFDIRSGRILCEAGVLLKDIQRLVNRHGWRLPVVPGTQFVTVGGAIANDIHGKNHHRYGTFGEHVLRLSVARTDGALAECHPGEALFAATVGGLGLTGVIVEAEIQLAPLSSAWLTVESIPYASLTEFFELADQSESDWENTVAWIDCFDSMGRGIFSRAKPAPADEGRAPSNRSLGIRVQPPVSLVNAFTVRLFNRIYHYVHKSRGVCVQHQDAFHHPLDHVRDWNLMYGPQGFYQYQCVVPRQGAQEAVRSMLAATRKAGSGSFLAVLKTFSDRPAVGMLSFPMPGVTLALDFPNAGEKTLKLLTELDAIVEDFGGRLYMAKDARMPAALFRSGYPRLAEFLPHRDPGISSSMSRRLMDS